MDIGSLFNIINMDPDIVSLFGSVSFGLSLLGGIFVMTIYAMCSEMRIFAYRIVLYLAIADSLSSVFYLIPTFSEAG
jgi:hypothetical protein